MSRVLLTRERALECMNEVAVSPGRGCIRVMLVVPERSCHGPGRLEGNVPLPPAMQGLYCALLGLAIIIVKRDKCSEVTRATR